jgi:hypothetical protein
MPSESDQQLCKLIEEEAAKRRERLAWALENGGLPTEEEAQEVWRKLNAAFDEIESLVMRIDRIAEAGELDDELGFAVTLEHVGVLTMLAIDIDDRARDFAKFAAQVRGRADSLLATRATQQFKVERRESSNG